MSSNTPNLGLLKKDPMVDGNETFNIKTMLNDNWDKIDEVVGTVRNNAGSWGITANDGNAYSVTLTPAPKNLAPGLTVKVKINAASSGAPTLNVNELGGKNVLKPGGSAASFKQDGVYTLVFDGTAFILQGEGGEIGTASSPQVLEGFTVVTEEGLTSGTMKNHKDKYISPGSENVLIEEGYYNGKGYIRGDANLKTANIRGGTNIFGVAGDPMVVNTTVVTTQAATANDLIAGKTAIVNGVKIVGNIPRELPESRVKKNEFLEEEWNKPPTDENEGWNLVEVDDSGNIYIVKSYSPSFIKYNPNGEIIWTYDHGAFNIPNFAIGPDNSVYIGTFSSTELKLVTKLSAAGVKIWTLEENGIVNGMFVDRFDNLYVAEHSNGRIKYLRKYSGSGKEIWSKTDSYLAGAGSIYVTPFNELYVTTRNSGALHKFDALTGTKIWTKTDLPEPDHVVVDRAGEITVGCYSSSGIALRKLRSDGTTIWSKLQDNRLGYANDVVLDDDDNIYSLHDGWQAPQIMIKHSPDGTMVWEERNEHPRAQSLAVDRFKNIVVVGRNIYSTKVMRKLTMRNTYTIQ